MKRAIGSMAVAAAIALGGSAPAAGADNQPPVAVDDPAIPACMPTDAWGGSFPLVEDYVGSDPQYPGWFMFVGACGPLANDTDADNDPLTLDVVGDPAHGSVEWLQDGFLAYHWDADYSTQPGDVAGGTWASDVIMYRAFDGAAYSEPAAYRVWIAPVNDPPAFTPGPDLVQAVLGAGPVAVTWATDISPGPANESDQTVRFDLDVDLHGGAPSMFAAPPAIDADGVLTFTPGTTPGVATLTVVARDDGGLEDYGLPATIFIPPDDTSDPVTLMIAIGPGEPAPPRAVDDEVSVPEDRISIFDVLGNDSDPNGDPLGITVVTPPAHGESGPADEPGSVGYVPAPDYVGPDAFTYTISDGTGRSDTATVHVTVTNTNDAPVAVDDIATVAEGASVTIPVPGNDDDVDGDALVVASLTQPAHGTAQVTAGGIRYTAPVSPAFTGVDTFTYEVADGHGSSAAAEVEVTVLPDATGPVVAGLGRTLPRQAIGTSTVSVRLAWAGSDAGTGIASYQLQERVGSGSWRTVTLASPTSTSVTRTLALGTSYDYRVRAADRRANVGAWADWTAFAPRRSQQTSSLVRWTGTWATVADDRFSAGSARRTSSTGRRATYSFTGRDVGWVTARSTVGGRAEVRIDGVLVATIDTDATAAGYRRMIFTRHLATGGPHTLEIRPLGDGRVTVDAFVVLP